MRMQVDKKASGLSLNMVVIAVIAMVVLVVVLAVFGNKMRQSNQEREDAVSGFNSGVCNNKTHHCVGSEDSCDEESGDYIDCPYPNKCCERPSSEQ
ncbi:MAG: hypothetical protein R6V50_01715 [Thermoplasmatota archaeon]